MNKFNITPAQRWVLRLTYLGYRQKEIGEILEITPATVNTIRVQAYKRLGIHGKHELRKPMFKGEKYARE